MLRPLTYAGDGKIQVMTNDEVITVAKHVLEYMVDNPGVGTANTTETSFLVGTFEDTVLTGNIGDTAYTLSGDVQTFQSVNIYQDFQSEIVEPDPRKPLTYDPARGPGTIREYSEEELNTFAANILNYAVLNDGPGSLVIDTSAPAGGTWDIVLTVNEYIDLGTTQVTKYLYQKTAEDSYSVVRPLRMGGATNHNLQLFKDEDLDALAGRVRQQILSSNVGEYRLATSAPSPGTWVAKGSFVDTRRTVEPASYDSREFTASFARNFDNTGTYVAGFLDVYAAEYNAPVFSYLGQESYIGVDVAGTNFAESKGAGQTVLYDGPEANGAEYMSTNLGYTAGESYVTLYGTYLSQGYDSLIFPIANYGGYDSINYDGYLSEGEIDPYAEATYTTTYLAVGLTLYTSVSYLGPIVGYTAVGQYEAPAYSGPGLYISGTSDTPSYDNVNYVLGPYTGPTGDFDGPTYVGPVTLYTGSFDYESTTGQVYEGPTYVGGVEYYILGLDLNYTADNFIQTYVADYSGIPVNYIGPAQQLFAGLYLGPVLYTGDYAGPLGELPAGSANYVSATALYGGYDPNDVLYYVAAYSLPGVLYERQSTPYILSLYDQVQYVLGPYTGPIGFFDGPSFFGPATIYEGDDQRYAEYVTSYLNLITYYEGQTYSGNYAGLALPVYDGPGPAYVGPTGTYESGLHGDYVAPAYYVGLTGPGSSFLSPDGDEEYVLGLEIGYLSAATISYENLIGYSAPPATIFYPPYVGPTGAEYSNPESRYYLSHSIYIGDEDLYSGPARYIGPENYTGYEGETVYYDRDYASFILASYQGGVIYEGTEAFYHSEFLGYENLGVDYAGYEGGYLGEVLYLGLLNPEGPIPYTAEYQTDYTGYDSLGPDYTGYDGSFTSTYQGEHVYEGIINPVFYINSVYDSDVAIVYTQTGGSAAQDYTGFSPVTSLNYEGTLYTGLSAVTQYTIATLTNYTGPGPAFLNYEGPIQYGGFYIAPTTAYASDAYASTPGTYVGPITNYIEGLEDTGYIAGLEPFNYITTYTSGLPATGYLGQALVNYASSPAGLYEGDTGFYLGQDEYTGYVGVSGAIYTAPYLGLDYVGPAGEFYAGGADYLGPVFYVSAAAYDSLTAQYSTQYAGPEGNFDALYSADYIGDESYTGAVPSYIGDFEGPTAYAGFAATQSYLSDYEGAANYAGLQEYATFLGPVDYAGFLGDAFFAGVGNYETGYEGPADYATFLGKTDYVADDSGYDLSIFYVGPGQAYLSNPVGYMSGDEDAISYDTTIAEYIDPAGSYTGGGYLSGVLYLKAYIGPLEYQGNPGTFYIGGYVGPPGASFDAFYVGTIPYGRDTYNYEGPDYLGDDSHDGDQSQLYQGPVPVLYQSEFFYLGVDNYQAEYPYLGPTGAYLAALADYESATAIYATFAGPTGIDNYIGSVQLVYEGGGAGSYEGAYYYLGPTGNYQGDLNYLQDGYTGENYILEDVLDFQNPTLVYGYGNYQGLSSYSADFIRITNANPYIATYLSDYYVGALFYIGGPADLTAYVGPTGTYSGPPIYQADPPYLGDYTGIATALYEGPPYEAPFEYNLGPAYVSSAYDQNTYGAGSYVGPVLFYVGVDDNFAYESASGTYLGQLFYEGAAYVVTVLDYITTYSRDLIYSASFEPYIGPTGTFQGAQESPNTGTVEYIGTYTGEYIGDYTATYQADLITPAEDTIATYYLWRRVA